jgi:hypothetical protein
MELLPETIRRKGFFYNLEKRGTKALIYKHKINKASVRPLLRRVHLKVHQDYQANHHKVNHLD